MSFETCILWNNNGTSDKIWGVTEHCGQPVSFWGRRDRELQFKLLKESLVDNLIKDKLGRGYRRTSFDYMASMQPDFKERFEHMLIMCIVGDAFHDPRKNKPDSL